MDKAIEVKDIRTTDIIAAEIITIRDQTKRLVLAASVEIGRRLCEAKDMLHHGEWGAWLTERVQYSQSTANNLMRIYREYGDEQVRIGAEHSISQTFEKLDYSQAVALFALAPDEREDFIEEHDIEDTSVRELKNQIAEYQAQLDRERDEREKAKADYTAELEKARAELRETEKLIIKAKEDGSAAAQMDIKILADKVEAQKAAIEKWKEAQDKQKSAAEKLKSERDDLKKKLDGARKDIAVEREESERLKAVMDERDKEFAGGVRKAVQEKLDAALAEERRKLEARADPDIAVCRVLFDATVENINRLRGLAAKADGEKKEKMVTILRALAGKITDGLT